jgi:iron uptake system component EfeO
VAIVKVMAMAMTVLAACSGDEGLSPPPATQVVGQDLPEPSETTAVPLDELQAAATEYHRLVVELLGALQTNTTRFTDAVRRGDLSAARELYPTMREPWEMIEPVVEGLPVSATAIDGLSEDFALAEADPGFTGFHALEYFLWAQGSTGNGAVVDEIALAARLDADIAIAVGAIGSLVIEPGEMTNGAATLIEEAAQTKVVGLEDRYSHTDLAMLDANVRGARHVFDLVETMLRSVDVSLADTIAASFAEVGEALDPYRGDDSFVSYDEVTEADRNHLKTSTAQLAEALARLTGSLGLEVEG